MVIELPERTSTVGWSSCKAEITGRTRRSALSFLNIVRNGLSVGEKRKR